MKRHFIYFFLLMGVLILAPQFPAKALEAATMQVSDLRMKERGGTFATFQMKVEDYDGAANSVAIYYKKKGDSDMKISYALPFLFPDFTGMGYTQDGTNYVYLWNLLPDTTYQYYLVTRQGEETTRGKVKTFTTRPSAYMVVDGVSPQYVNVGDLLKIVGQGFGTQKGDVKVGYCYQCNDEVQSWSDNKIIVKVGSHATNGPVKVSAFPFSGSSTARGSSYHDISYGQNIAVKNGQNNIYVLGGQRSQCKEGLVSSTYRAIENINNIYFEEYGRGAKCDELTFHLQRKTDHARLRAWLNEQKEGQWWTDLLTTYEGKLIYDNNPKAVYLVTDTELRRVPSLQVALAHGFIIDDAILMKDLDDKMHEGQVRYADFNPLAYTDGFMWEEVESAIQGKSALYNSQLDDYFNTHSKLFTKAMPERSDDKDYNDICTFVTCGKIY